MTYPPATLQSLRTDIGTAAVALNEYLQHRYVLSEPYRRHIEAMRDCYLHCLVNWEKK